VQNEFVYLLLVIKFFCNSSNGQSSIMVPKGNVNNKIHTAIDGSHTHTHKSNLTVNHTSIAKSCYNISLLPCCGTSPALLLNFQAQGLRRPEPRNIAEAHLSKNASGYGWRNCKPHALAELFRKPNKSSFVSPDGLV
jgi:hypothetical protein